MLGASMSPDALITIVVFLAVYVLIAFEWLNKAIAALLGVMTLLILGVIDEHAAAGFIDYETIMLLIGMMGIGAPSPCSKRRASSSWLRSALPNLPVDSHCGF